MGLEIVLSEQIYGPWTVRKVRTDDGEFWEKRNGEPEFQRVIGQLVDILDRNIPKIEKDGSDHSSADVLEKDDQDNSSGVLVPDTLYGKWTIRKVGDEGWQKRTGDGYQNFSKVMNEILDVIHSGDGFGFSIDQKVNDAIIYSSEKSGKSSKSSVSTNTKDGQEHLDSSRGDKLGTGYSADKRPEAPAKKIGPKRVSYQENSELQPIPSNKDVYWDLSSLARDLAGRSGKDREYAGDLTDKLGMMLGHDMFTGKVKVSNGNATVREDLYNEIKRDVMTIDEAAGALGLYDEEIGCLLADGMLFYAFTDDSGPIVNSEWAISSESVRYLKAEFNKTKSIRSRYVKGTDGERTEEGREYLRTFVLDYEKHVDLGFGSPDLAGLAERMNEGPVADTLRKIPDDIRERMKEIVARENHDLMDVNVIQPIKKYVLQ